MKTKTIITVSLVGFAVVGGSIIAASLLTKKKPSNSPEAASTPCVITIQHKRYDVAALRSTHSGGDVFVCDTDMTKTFFSHHDQEFLDARMGKYRMP